MSINRTHPRALECRKRIAVARHKKLRSLDMDPIHFKMSKPKTFMNKMVKLQPSKVP
jgi:hypothetical protein